MQADMISTLDCTFCGQPIGNEPVQCYGDDPMHCGCFLKLGEELDQPTIGEPEMTSIAQVNQAGPLAYKADWFEKNTPLVDTRQIIKQAETEYADQEVYPAAYGMLSHHYEELAANFKLLLNELRKFRG